MARIEVERISDDRLTREVWRFSPDCSYFSSEVDLRLNYYGTEQRETTRHKFKVNSRTRWDSSDQRSYNSGISAASVPMPADVVDEARRQVCIVVVGASGEEYR